VGSDALGFVAMGFMNSPLADVFEVNYWVVEVNYWVPGICFHPRLRAATTIQVTFNMTTGSSSSSTIRICKWHIPIHISQALRALGNTREFLILGMLTAPSQLQFA
jgi:hypothetical protein